MNDYRPDGEPWDDMPIPQPGVRPESLFPYNDADEICLEIAVTGVTMYLNHNNTTIYTYPRFPELDHVYHGYPDPSNIRERKYTAIFNSNGLIMMLRKMYFPEDVRPRPTPWDESAFMEFQRQTLESELNDL